MCPSASFNILNTNNSTIPTVVSSEPIITSKSTNISNSKSAIQQNNSIALDQSLNSTSIIKQDSVIPGSNVKSNSLDTNLPKLSITKKRIQNSSNLDNSNVNNNTFLNNNTTNTILNNTLNINNTTLYNSSNANNTILNNTSNDNNIILNGNVINVNCSNEANNTSSYDISQNFGQSAITTSVNNNYTKTNNSYINNLTFPKITLNNSIPLASTSQIIPEHLNIDNSKHYHSLGNINQLDIPSSSYSYNDTNKTNFVHFSPSFSHVCHVDSSKTSVKKKRTSFSTLSDLFNTKLIPKSASITAVTSRSGEYHGKNLFKSIIKKDKKKMDTTQSSSIFSEFKNSLKKSDTFSIKSDSNDKKKKKRKSYIKILRHSRNNEKENINNEINNINRSVTVPISNEISFTKSGTENMNSYQKSKKEKCKKNKMKIKIGFNRMKISKKHKMKKLDKRNNSVHSSIHCSKSKLGNTSFSSSSINSIHHNNKGGSNSSFEYKISLSHGRSGHLTKNGNIQDDPYYSFSEDVFNSLSNMESFSTTNHSFNHQSMTLQQNSQIIPSRTSSHSVILNNSSFILPSSLPLNTDSYSLTQNKNKIIPSSLSQSQSKISILSGQSIDQQSCISGKSLENEIISVTDNIQHCKVIDSRLNDSRINYQLQPSNNVATCQEVLKENTGLKEDNIDNIVSTIGPGGTESLSSKENYNKQLLNLYQDQSITGTPQVSDHCLRRQNSNEIRSQRLQVLRQQRRRPSLTPLEKGETGVDDSIEVSKENDIDNETFPENNIHKGKEVTTVEHSCIKNKKDTLVGLEVVSEGPIQVLEENSNPLGPVYTDGPLLLSSFHGHIPTNDYVSSTLAQEDFIGKRNIYGGDDINENSLQYNNSIDSHCQSIYEKYRKLSHYNFDSRLGSVEPTFNRHSSLKFSPQHSYSHNRLKSLPSDKDISISISTTSSSSLDSMYLKNSNELHLNHSSSLRTNSRNDYILNRSTSFRRAYPQSSYTSFDNINYSLPVQQNKIKSHEVSPEVKPVSIISNSTNFTNTNSSSFEKLACYDESYIFSSSPQPPLLAHHASINCSNRDLYHRPPVFRNQSVKEDFHSYRNTRGEYGCYYCQPPQEYEGEIGLEGTNPTSGDVLNPSVTVYPSAPSEHPSFISMITSVHNSNANSVYDSSSLIIPKSKLTTSMIPPSPKPEEDLQKSSLILNSQGTTPVESLKGQEQQEYINSEVSTVIPKVIVIEENTESENVNNVVSNIPVEKSAQHLQPNILTIENIQLKNDVHEKGPEHQFESVQNIKNDNILVSKDHKVNDSNSNNIINISKLQTKTQFNVVSRSKSISNITSGSDLKVESENIIRSKSISCLGSNFNTSSKSKRYSRTSYSNRSSNYVHSPLIVECIPTVQEDEVNLLEKEKDNSNFFNDNTLLNRKKIEKRAKHQSDQMYGEVPLLKRLSFISLSKLPVKSTNTVNTERFEYSPLLAYTSLPRYSSKRKSLDPTFGNYQCTNATSTSSFQYPSIPPTSLSILSTDSYRFEDDLKCLLRFSDRWTTTSNHEKLKSYFDIQESSSIKDDMGKSLLNKDKSYYYFNGLLDSSSFREEMPSTEIIRKFLESYTMESHLNNPFCLTKLIQMNELEMATKDIISNDHASEYYSFDREEGNYPSLTYPLTSWEKRKALMILNLSLHDTILQHYDHIIYKRRDEGKEISNSTSDIENDQFIPTISSPEEIQKTWRNKEEAMTNRSISVKRLSNLSKRSFPSFLKNGESKTILTSVSGRIASVQTLFDENDDSKVLEQLPSGVISSSDCYNIEIFRNDSHPTINAQLRHITSVKTLCNSNHTSPLMMNLKNDSNIFNETSPILEVPNDKNSKFIISGENNSNISVIPPVSTTANSSFVITSDENTSKLVTPELVSSPEMEYRNDEDDEELSIYLVVPVSENGEKVREGMINVKGSTVDNISEFQLFEKLSSTSTHSDSDDKISLNVPSFHSSPVNESGVVKRESRNTNDHQTVPNVVVSQEQYETESLLPIKSVSKSIIKESKGIEISENEISIPTQTTTTDLQGKVMDHFSSFTTTNDEYGIKGSSITDSIQNSILEYNDMSSPSLSTINSFNTNNTSFEFSHQTSYLSINLKDNHEIHRTADISDNNTDLSYILNNYSSIDINLQDFALERQIDNSSPLLSDKGELIDLPSDIYPLEYIDIHGEISPLKFTSMKSLVQNQPNHVSQLPLFTETNNLSNKTGQNTMVVESNEKEKLKVGEPVASNTESKKSKRRFHVFKLCSFKHRHRRNNKSKRMGSSPNHSFIQNQNLLRTTSNVIGSKPITVDINSTEPTKTVSASSSAIPVYLKQRKSNIIGSRNSSMSLVKSNRLRKKISLQSLKSITKDKRDRFYSHHLNHSASNLNQYIKSKLKPFDHLLVNKRKTFIEKDVNNSSIIIHDESGTSTEYHNNGFLSSIKNGKSLIFKDDDEEYDESDEKYKSFNRILKDFDSPSDSEFNSSSRDYSSPFENSLTASKKLVSIHSQGQLKIVQHVDDNAQEVCSESSLMILKNDKILNVEELQEKLQEVAQNQQQEEKQNFIEDLDEQNQNILVANTKPLIKPSNIEEDAEPTEKSNISFYNPDFSVFRYPPISPDASTKSSVSSISDLDDIISSIQPSFVKSTCESELEFKEEILNPEIIKLNLGEQNNTISNIELLVGKNEEFNQDCSTDSKLNTTLEFKQVTNIEEVDSNSNQEHKQNKKHVKKSGNSSDYGTSVENSRKEKEEFLEEKSHEIIKLNDEGDKEKSNQDLTQTSFELTSIKALASESYPNDSQNEVSSCSDIKHVKYIDDITKDTQKYIIPNHNTGHHIHHITDKIVQKFKKKSFMSLKSRSSQSNIISSPVLSNADISYITLPSMTKSPQSSILNSINYLNIDSIQSPKLSSKSCGAIEFNTKSRISMNNNNYFKDRLKLKVPRKSVIEPSNFVLPPNSYGNSSNKKKSNSPGDIAIYNNYTLDKVIPYILTSNSENMNFIMNSISNQNLIKLENRQKPNSTNIKPNKYFCDILNQLEKENCKSSKEHCSDYVKESISDFNSKLNDFHWTYKSEKFPIHLLNRIKIKEECDKLKEKDHKEDKKQELDEKEP